MQKSEFGRKVFFLNPPTVMNDVFEILANAEFEVYHVVHHQRLARYLARYPDCLLFVNIDDGGKEDEWREWIKGIKSEPACTACTIGVMTMLASDEKRKFYLMEVGVSSFITLSQGINKTAEILLKTLDANEARGRRRYVRAQCPSDSGSFNCNMDGDIIRGVIHDLSSVGMAVEIEGAKTYQTGTRMSNIQLQLKGTRIILNGVLMGQRDGPGAVPVMLIMFDPASLDDEKKYKLRQYIRKTLQLNIDELLRTF